MPKPNTKVIKYPIIIRPNSWKSDVDMHDQLYHVHHDSLKLTDKWEDDYGSGNRHGRDYWHARRAFLNSYHFQEQHDELYFKDKLKRWMKEVNETALGVISKYCRELSNRRLGVRVFCRVKLGLPSLDILVSMRCFTPWFNKKGLM